MKMGINFSFGSIMVVVAVIFLISILPEKICVPFTTTCLYLEPLHYLKTTLTYVIAVTICLVMVAGFLLLISKAIKFFRSDKAFKPLIMFLLTFDEKYYYNLKKAI